MRKRAFEYFQVNKGVNDTSVKSVYSKYLTVFAIGTKFLRDRIRKSLCIFKILVLVGIYGERSMSMN